MKLAAVSLVLLLAASVAGADPLPVAKPPGPGGSCPHGWTSSGSFCVPGQGAQDAVAKPPNGTCPFGWISSGSYCLRSGNVRRCRINLATQEPDRADSILTAPDAVRQSRARDRGADRGAACSS
jgi:hypothetical protein